MEQHTSELEQPLDSDPLRSLMPIPISPYPTAYTCDCWGRSIFI